MDLKKWIATVIGFLFALFVLFGGRMVYQKVQIEQPIEKALTSISGIQLDTINYDQNSVEVKIKVQDIKNFSDTYHMIQDKLQPLLGKRELQLKFIGDEDQTLLHAWNKAYFDIAQAIDHKEYSVIPGVIEKIKKQSSLEKVGYGLDDRNVYIDLHNGKNSLYLILSREDKQEVSMVD